MLKKKIAVPRNSRIPLYFLKAKINQFDFEKIIYVNYIFGRNWLFFLIDF